MTKLLLFPNFQSYILSLTAMQSQDTFLKMESIAKQQIESFAGLNDIFLGEVVSSSNHDGFVHHPQGTITKYKGLGQMSDEDLKNSMFNEEWQRLEPISFSKEGLESLINLMGEEVEKRKEFVYNCIDFNKFSIE